MPVTLTYPGVYIEEIPSGVRTITGVATSIAAFIGRALRGPTDEAVVINSYADFERIFGGLWAESSLGFAVRDFYLNGGGQAIIVRLFHEPAEEPAEEEEDGGDSEEALPVYTPLDVAGLTLQAAYPGSWGENLRATVDVNVSAEAADALGLEEDDLFNLAVRDTSPNGLVEQYRHLTFGNTDRRIDLVLAAESRLVRWRGPDPEGDLPTAIQDAHAATDPNEREIDDPVTQAAEALRKKKLSDPNGDMSGEEQELAAARAVLRTQNGERLTQDDFIGPGKDVAKAGLFALRDADLFNILCLPPYTLEGDVDPALVATAAAFCEDERAMLLVDPRSTWDSKDDAKSGVDQVGTRSKNAALFFPRLRQPNPLRENRIEDFVPCGAVAGIFARTDRERGVWKAPAGLDATLVGVPELSVKLTDMENGELNPLGANCLRTMPAAGPVLWGTRTLQGDDRLASEWKYIPVRRLALFIEESLYRGTHWVVFEPNDEPLWGQIRLNVGAFMHNLFRQGAFQGSSPREAYFVKCDKETTTQTHINLGIVNIIVGFAPLKPAEFVVIKLQQMAGQIQT